MTNRHRRITLQQQLRHRTPDNLAATDDTSIRPTNLDATVVKQVDDARGRARYENRSSQRQPACIHRMKAVDVFQWTHRFDDRRLIDMSRQRKLHEDPV